MSKIVICPQCGKGYLFTHDAIIVECDECNFVSASTCLLEEDEEADE